MERAKQMTKQGAVLLIGVGVGFLLGMMYATPQEETSFRAWAIGLLKDKLRME